MACSSLRDQIAAAALAALIQSGQAVSVTFTAAGASGVSVYAAIEPMNRSVTLNTGAGTDMQTFSIFIPRQTGFPPSAIGPGATITYGSTVYDASNWEANDGTLSECSGVTFVTETYGERFVH